MGEHVIGQMSVGAQSLAADAADVRLLARVGPHVDLQVAAFGEAPPAGFTGERSLPRVSPEMLNQIVLEVEDSLTELTFQR